MKKLLFGTAIAALTSTFAYAGDYQFEAGGFYVDGDVDDFDFDAIGGYVSYYFDRVDTSKGPYLEAAFLDKASDVTLLLTSVDPDAEGADDSNDISVSTRIVFENDFILEASYTDLDAADDNAIEVGVGTYLSNNMDLIVSYSTVDEADIDEISVDLHAVTSLTGETFLSYDLGLAYVDVENDDGFSINGGVNYFFNRSFSVGTEISFTSLDDSDVSTLSIGTDYFITSDFQVSAFYQTLGQDADGNQFGVGVAFRF